MKRRARELSLQQCYDALGLEQGADLEALKHAYRRRAFELHPDLHPDNPQAGQEFQVVNEAYVILARLLSPEQQGAAAEEKTPGDAADAEAQRQKEAQKAASDAQGPRPESGDKAQGQHEGARDGKDERTRRAAQAAYAKEEDVLRDLLDDPFARRVFEDIYAQMKDAQAPPSPPPPQPDAGEKSAAQENTAAEWGKGHLNLDFSRGIGKAVKSWMRRQIDEEQTFYLAPSMLKPGARIRLQIRRGLSEEVSTVELTLPQDYAAGKPVRLKGLGRRIGRWQGDLYLTLVAKH